MQKPVTPEIGSSEGPLAQAGWWRSTIAPLLTIFALAVLTGYLLDGAAIAERDAWPEALYTLARQLTNLGKSGWILVSSALVLAGAFLTMRKAPTAGLQAKARIVATSAGYIFAAVALSGISVNLAKRLIGRARPEHFSDYGLFGFSPFSGSGFESFPSGHSTTDGALCAALAIMFPPLRVPLLIAGAFLALTRVIVGAHYPSDIVAGFGYGVWFSIMTAGYFRARGLSFKSL